MQVYAMPVFDMLERMMMKKVYFPPGIALRLITRSVYVGEITISHKSLSLCHFWLIKP